MRGWTYAEAQLNEQNELMAADAAKVQGDRATVAFAEQQLTRFGMLAKDGAGNNGKLAAGRNPTSACGKPRSRATRRR